MPNAILSVTETAAIHMQELMSQPAASAATAVRIGVKGSGCSGMAYFMDYSTPQPGDEVIEASNGVTVVVDAQSLMHLLGTEIDYIDQDTQKGFVFNNPNERGRCGCGESFHTDDEKAA